MGTGRFELRRFGWATPDRLEVDGRFVGLEEAVAGDPILVLHGSDRTHRLPAVANETDGVDADAWHAAFKWRDTPTPFDVAELEFGDDLVVDLPSPQSDDADSDGDVLDVRRRGGAERLRLQAELLAVRSELTETRTQLERAEKELAQSREELTAEREARTADAEEFRAGLAQTQAAADDAIAEGLAELPTLRARVDELAADAGEAERLRGRLDAIRDLLEDGAEGSRDASDATPP